MRHSDARGAQRFANIVEVSQLRRGLRRSVIRRRGEVGHQPIQAGVLRIGKRRQDLRRAGSRAQAPHARIDLEMVADGLPRRGGETVHIANLRQGVDGRREIEFHHRIAFVGQKAAHDENPRAVDTVRAQLHALVHRTHRQPPGARLREHARHFQRAMPVSVRLDHAGHLHMRTHHGAHIAEVARDLLARHQNVGSERSGHFLIVKGGRVSQGESGATPADPVPTERAPRFIDSMRLPIRAATVRGYEVFALKGNWQAKAPAPPLQADDSPLVAQAAPPANCIFSQLLRERSCGS